MSINYSNYVSIFKALSDETRLKIIEMLSCGEMCACDILELVSVSQSTLSYHMKTLTDSGLVVGRKEGSWVKYSVNKEISNEAVEFLGRLTENKSDCQCKTVKNISNQVGILHSEKQTCKQ